MKTKDLFKLTWWPVLLGSLCCLSPVILVLLGLSTAGFAATLSDTLYGTYRWWFRAIAALGIILSVLVYLRREKKICSLDQAKRRRNEIINILALAFIFGAVAYVIWLYVVVEYVGKWLRIWP
ncbi:MAG: hypothetical protein HYT15_03075 [Candidatus Magasanikbacteria bacterium]|nr:hypothetical protein [Candidatus Magasanikbacteria bacterium]